MNFIKIELCRRHWQSLAPHVKDRETAKHLLAAVEIAERLLRENNKLEMENRELRILRDSRANDRRETRNECFRLRFALMRIEQVAEDEDYYISPAAAKMLGIAADAMREPNNKVAQAAQPPCA